MKQVSVCALIAVSMILTVLEIAVAYLAEAIGAVANWAESRAIALRKDISR